MALPADCLAYLHIYIDAHSGLTLSYPALLLVTLRLVSARSRTDVQHGQ